MQDDIIFHLTTQKLYLEHTQNSIFRPESLEEEGFIHCSTGSQVQETANRLFSAKDQILLLVIDVSTLSNELKYEDDEQQDEQFPHIYGPLNTGAVIDKLQIFAEKDGSFDITFSSKT